MTMHVKAHSLYISTNNRGEKQLALKAFGDDCRPGVPFSKQRNRPPLIRKPIEYIGMDQSQW